MKHSYKVLSFFWLLILVFFCTALKAQESHSQYQNQNFRHFDRYVYQADERFHTSVKPFLNHQVDSIVSLDSLYRIPVSNKAWDIVFNRHLIQFDKKAFKFNIDPLFNFEVGKDADYEDVSWINTRGFIVNGSIGSKFSFSTSFYENQAVFNDYRGDLIKKYGVVPGQGQPKAYKENGIDYAYAEAYASYTPNQYFNFQLGHGKNFIGDGYRSLLLSDNAFSYPYFKITTDVWNIKYMMLWMQFQDLAQSYPYGHANDKKWGAFHYLDWSIAPWLNIGLFEAVVWQNQDSLGYRGFDFNYANPLIFFRPVEFSVGSPDNVLLGVNGKITLWRKQVFYGQLMLDEFKLDEITNYQNGWWANKYGIQGGYKTFDMFRVKHLDFQTEVNFVRPFMYSHVSSLKNYAHYNSALAHPLGSNFLESVTFVRYNHKRMFFDFRYSYAIHGSDTAGLNYGNDIMRSYNDRAQEYNNFLGQAEEVVLTYATVTAAYLVNPVTNLNVYVSYTNRKERSNSIDKNQGLITLGIRTSLGNFYYDN